MKLIPLRQFDELKTKDVLMAVLRQPNKPTAGIDYEEMRKRIRLLDMIEPAKDEVRLEDADHKFLAEALKTFPFNVAERNLLTILDDVIEAKSPSE